VMKSTSPVDSDVCLLLVQFHCPSWKLTKFKQAIKHWTVLSNIDCKRRLTSLHLLAELYIVITVVLCHLFTTGMTHVDLHFPVQAIVEEEVVGHANPVGLHGMALAIVVRILTVIVIANFFLCSLRQRHFTPITLFRAHRFLSLAAQNAH
uniref:Uncharacterized protein n=1 Tax=Sphaeramia orbicularis TaxID=375764 RepID=A0A673A844_9TELE